MLLDAYVRRLAVLTTLAVVASNAHGQSAESPALRRAKAAMDAIDYAGAAQLLDEAYRGGKLAPAELAQLWRLKGVVEAALGHSASASDAFSELHALAPDTKLDDGLPPRVVDAFEKARASAAPLALRCEIDRARQMLVVELKPGSSKKVRFVRIDRRQAGTPKSRNRVGTSAQVPLPNAPASYRCVAVDEHDNEWAYAPGQGSFSWQPSPGAATSPSLTRSSAPAKAPLWRNPWLWGAAAATTLAVGTTFGVLARNDQSDFDRLRARSDEVEFTAAQRVLDRGRARATTANLLFVGGGALAVAALVIYFTQPDEPTNAAVSRIGVGPNGLVYAGSF